MVGLKLDNVTQTRSVTLHQKRPGRRKPIRLNGTDRRSCSKRCDHQKRSSAVISPERNKALGSSKKITYAQESGWARTKRSGSSLEPSQRVRKGRQRRIGCERGFPASSPREKATIRRRRVPRLRAETFVRLLSDSLLVACVAWALTFVAARYSSQGLVHMSRISSFVVSCPTCSTASTKPLWRSVASVLESCKCYGSSTGLITLIILFLYEKYSLNTSSLS